MIKNDTITKCIHIYEKIVKLSIKNVLTRYDRWNDHSAATIVMRLRYLPVDTARMHFEMDGVDLLYFALSYVKSVIRGKKIA